MGKWIKSIAGHFCICLRWLFSNLFFRDRHFIKRAIELAKRSKDEDTRPHPKVGVVVVLRGMKVGEAYRGQFGPGNHGEYCALEKVLRDDFVTGATIYATLEPCTARNHPKMPCVERIIERRVCRVVIGMIDPNPVVNGKGRRRLENAGIQVDMFPEPYKSRVEELNREFLRVYNNPNPVNVDPQRTEGAPWLIIEIEDEVDLEQDILLEIFSGMPSVPTFSDIAEKNRLRSGGLHQKEPSAYSENDGVWAALVLSPAGGRAEILMGIIPVGGDLGSAHAKDVARIGVHRIRSIVDRYNKKTGGNTLRWAASICLDGNEVAAVRRHHENRWILEGWDDE